ncbi:MAG: glycosyltransferase family 4 protein [Solirubrobacterales bacterium]|nr:glycosyltransferase family 4 protein [Solirubrobacterales bacterium]
MILFLHHRYRMTGGEERGVADLMWLVREWLGEDAELIARDSSGLSRHVAGAGLLAGGLHPETVARAVRRTRARIVHAHNVHQTFGWRALSAARSAGARVVLHLHQYRMVCAIGVCFRDGTECMRCHGRNTLPGIALNCRGSRAEALAYGAGLAVWQRRLAAHVDAFVVPSRFAGVRLAELGAPIRAPLVVPHVVRETENAGMIAAGPVAPDPGVSSENPDGHHPGAPFALVVGRLTPEKGIDVAIDACGRLGLDLVVAGDGPERERLAARAAADRPPAAGRAARAVRFLGAVAPAELAALRRRAVIGLMPSRSAETFGLAAAEAMAAGLPMVASRIGALPELVPEQWLAAPGDPGALAETIERVCADPSAPARAREAARATCAPEVVAPALRAAYEHATG